MEVTVLRSAHRLLDDAALEAVRQWQYTSLARRTHAGSLIESEA